MTRSITRNEMDVVRALIERCGIRPHASRHLAGIEDLVVTHGCDCGCASIDFLDVDEVEIVDDRILAKGQGVTAAGGSVGLILWGTREEVWGLEVHDYGDDADRSLPTLESIQPGPHPTTA